MATFLARWGHSPLDFDAFLVAGNDKKVIQSSRGKDNHAELTMLMSELAQSHHFLPVKQFEVAGK